MTIVPGCRVGPYQILGALGAGGMGEVFRARDSRLGRDVALKVLPPGLSQDAEHLRRFEREARALAALSHPNVLVVHDVGAHEGTPYLVTELLVGQTLRERLAGGPLPPSTALEWGLLIARGLAAAHEKGIVHRDLKPANVFITSDGGLKLLDFGLARQSASIFGQDLTEAPTQEMPTGVGAVLGTVGYMSPEQVRGEIADARSDVFALGALLYEMLSGHRAFSRATAADTVSAVLTDEPPEMEALARKCSAAVVGVLNHCLEKRREARFSSAHDVALALQTLTISSSRVAGASALREASLAVLPFQNLSPDPDNAYFADGLTEELIADLSKVRALRVTSRTSAMHFKGSSRPLPDIADALKVRYVVEGSVRRAGNSLRITAQLVEAATDTHLWAETYAGTLDDVFDVQEGVSRAIADALRIRLSPEEDRELASRLLPNAVAYDSYLRAYQEIFQWNARALERARLHLEKASTLIGEHPLLLAAASLIRFQLVNIGLSQEATLEEARRLADRSLALDSTLAQAHTARGMVATLEGDNPAAMAHFVAARAVAPGDVTTWEWLPWVYLMMGRTTAAAPLVEELMARDPMNPSHLLMPVLVPFFEGDFEASAQRADEVVGIAPDWPMFQFWNALVAAYAGRRAAALDALKAVPADPAPDAWIRFGLMLRAVLVGDLAEFERCLGAETVASVRRDGQLCYHLAAFAAELGQEAEAFGWLERAVDRTFVPVTLFRADPFLAPLRASPRFEGLLAQARQVQASVRDRP